MSLLSVVSTLDSSDALQKLAIDYEQKSPGSFTGQIKAMFNPAQLKFSKEVSWDFAAVAGRPPKAGYHRLSFRDSKPTTLAIELFFDTYEGLPPESSGGGLFDSLASSAASALSSLSPLAPPVSGVDVSTFTKEVAKLANLDAELHRPPRCKLRWGKFTLIEGVLTALSEDYTFFLPDGTPVRAALNCTFTEVIDAASTGAYSPLHSADVAKRWVVKEGDTLSGIAQTSYRDAGKWRVIAEANHLDDPRKLRPGTALLIPTLSNKS